MPPAYQIDRKMSANCGRNRQGCEEKRHWNALLRCTTDVIIGRDFDFWALATTLVLSSSFCVRISTPDEKSTLNHRKNDQKVMPLWQTPTAIPFEMTQRLQRLLMINIELSEYTWNSPSGTVFFKERSARFGSLEVLNGESNLGSSRYC